MEEIKTNLSSEEKDTENLNNQEIAKIKAINENNQSKEKYQSYKIILDKEMKAKVVYLAMCEDLGTSKQELQKILNEMIIQKINDEFNKKANNE